MAVFHSPNEETKQQNRKSGCFTERRGNRFFVFFLVDYIVPFRETAIIAKYGIIPNSC
jgi:hypothetical protein